MCGDSSTWCAIEHTYTRRYSRTVQVSKGLCLFIRVSCSTHTRARLYTAERMSYMDGCAHEHLFDPEKLWDNGTPTHAHTRAPNPNVFVCFSSIQCSAASGVHMHAKVPIAGITEYVSGLFHQPHDMASLLASGGSSKLLITSGAVFTQQVSKRW